MTTRPEDRIRAQYRARKKRERGTGRAARSPVREIKNIVRYHGRTNW